MFLLQDTHTADLGKVRRTFPAALFSVNTRFTRKIERPQRGIKWPVTTKQTQANERTSSEQNIQSKKNLQICCSKLIRIV